jgi:hypothetical protein
MTRSFFEMAKLLSLDELVRQELIKIYSDGSIESGLLKEEIEEGRCEITAEGKVVDNALSLSELVELELIHINQVGSIISDSLQEAVKADKYTISPDGIVIEKKNKKQKIEKESYLHLFIPTKYNVPDLYKINLVLIDNLDELKSQSSLHPELRTLKFFAPFGREANCFEILSHKCKQDKIQDPYGEIELNNDDVLLHVAGGLIQEEEEEKKQDKYLYYFMMTEDGIPYKYKIPLREVDNLDELKQQAKLGPSQRTHYKQGDDLLDCFSLLMKKFKHCEIRDVYGSIDGADLLLVVAGWE